MRQPRYLTSVAIGVATATARIAASGKSSLTAQWKDCALAVAAVEGFAVTVTRLFVSLRVGHANRVTRHIAISLGMTRVPPKSRSVATFARSATKRTAVSADSRTFVIFATAPSAPNVRNERMAVAES